MTQANCFFCSDRTTIERFGKPWAVQCVNAACGTQGPLRERRCDAVEAWNGIAARLGAASPTPHMPMLFVRAAPLDLTSH
jgi:hypothetical protein